MNLRRLAAVGNLVLAALLMLAIWVLVVWVASRPALKTLIDLTPQNVNSVDPATEELLRELREQRCEVEFHLFFPPLPTQAGDDVQRQWLSIRSRLREAVTLLLRRYVWLGGEAVTLREHDLYTDPAGSREAAQAFSVTEADDLVVVAVRQPGKERRFRKLSLLADLAEIQLPDQQAVPGPTPRVQVPTLKRYRAEVALSSALKGLLVQGTPVAYFLNSYSLALDLTNPNIGSAYGNLLGRLQQLGFDVRQLDLSRERVVPRDAALVVVLEPRREFTDLDAQALFAYCKRGGRLFLNYSWSAVPDHNPTGGKLGELLGYELSTAPVYHLIPDVRGGRRGLDGSDGVSKLQLSVNPNHPVTRRIAAAGRPMELAIAREVRERASPPGGMRRDPLLQTGPEGWLARPDAEGYPDNRAPQVGLREYLVGMAIEVEAEPDASAPAPGAPSTGQVVIVTGVFCNNAGLPLFGDLALNICNWMAERRVLLDIQGSQYEARIRLLLVFLVPGGFLLLGLLVYFVRRRA